MNWGTGGINHTLLTLSRRKEGLSSRCKQGSHQKCNGFRKSGHGMKPECLCECHKRKEGKDE